MSKRIKYKPIKQNETLDISVAFSQAAALIDQAAKEAISLNDPDLLLEVADRWITIGKTFAGEEEIKEHIDTDSKGEYGFRLEEGGSDNE